MADGIEMEGLQKIEEQVDKAGKVDFLLPPMHRAVLRLEARMKRYPNQRPGARYIRGRGPTNAAGQVIRLTSERLGSRWTTKVYYDGDTLTGKIGNNVSYGPYVESEQFQNRIFSGQWITDVKALHEEERTIRSDFENAINELGKG